MANAPDDEDAVKDKIGELPAFRDIAARLHEVITEAAPDLRPRLWYGMPGYALAKKSPVLWIALGNLYRNRGRPGCIGKAQ